MNRRLTLGLFASILFAFLGTGCTAVIAITGDEDVEQPTMVVAGSTSMAYFTVTNNSSRTFTDMHITSLPPNVVQVTEGGTFADTCGDPATLPSHGTCTLQLAISGQVSASDRIVACFNGDLTCARAHLDTDVLVLESIRIAPESLDLGVGETKELTATGFFSNGATRDIGAAVTWNSSDENVVTVSATGAAAGVAAGSGNVTASFQSLISDETAVEVAP